MKHGLTTALAAVAIMAGAAGCTSGGSDGAARGAAQNIAAKKACADGTYTWLNVSRHPVVNAMAVTTQKSGHKVSTRGVKPVARYTVSVRAEGAALPAKQVIRGLAQHLKPTLGDAFTLVDRTGRTTTHDKHDSYGVRTAKTSGRYVTATAYDLVEADFRYACGDKTVGSGHVVSWDPTEAEIILECGEKLSKEASDDSREAARLGCREGDPARA
ncbi:hypothetical protein ACWDSL_46315 [Streptomyces sp. NPDC000941]